MIPIIGARTKKQLADNLGCLEVELPPVALDRLDHATAIEMGFPHEFLRRPFVQNHLHGGLFERIHRHKE